MENPPADYAHESRWRTYAKCRDEDPEVFFATNEREQLTVALKFCKACIVAEQCLQFAVKMEIPFGVYGGTTEMQRRKLVRKTLRISSNVL